MKRTAPPTLAGRSVDVFIPTKNESVSILRKTLLACSDLRYPHRTLVLDDGNRPAVKALCEELHCVYLARGSSEDAKAGNLNYGLKHSSAEFIAVFDADHIPLPRFIDTLIGYFADPNIGFVQAPQEFYNIDSFQHRTDRKHKTIWGEQYLFFSLIQPGRDHWNAAYFVGSCAILRRKALDDIGGFATGSITEDMLTSIKIHAKKWSSVYHNEYLAYGIAAQTLKPFSIQRQRWGVGNWQVFVRANPLFVRGLSLPQRLCYISSMIYPLEGIQKLIFYVTPPIALFSGVLPMRALDVSYLLHFIPYFTISLFGFSEMSRGVGGQIMLEQYSMAKYFTYIKTLVIPFIPKKRQEFEVTPKNEEHLGSRRLIMPQFFILVLSFIAIAWALIELLLGRRSDSFIVAVNCFWALYNSGLALAIITFDYKKLFQRRLDFRVPDSILLVYRPLGSKKGQDETVAVGQDITEEGMAMLAVSKTEVGRELEVELILPVVDLPLRAEVIRQRSVTIDRYRISEVGLRFVGINQTAMDILARYIHESAVRKFMRDYVTEYKTYMERRFGGKEVMKDRSYRFLAYFPVVLRDRTGAQYYAVIKDCSKTGLLLASKKYWPVGSKLEIGVILGNDRFALAGDVVRDFTEKSEDFREYLLGIRLMKADQAKVKQLLSIADKIGIFVLK